jgi:hypothetical protein
LERGVAIQGESANSACRSRPEEASMRGRIIVVTIVLGIAAGMSFGRIAAQSPINCNTAPPIVEGGTVYGTGGADVIAADNGVAETIYGFGGNDTIFAGSGDIVFGGSGADTVQMVGGVAVLGEAGDDFITALGTPLVNGGSGNDTLVDGGGSALCGSAGNDRLVDGVLCDGGSGRDTAINCITRNNIEIVE